MTELAQVLGTHDRFGPPECLAKVLGDGYLLTHSFVFRNVRELARMGDFQYTDSPPFDYAALPLLMLDSIYERRCIPYFDNVSVLRELESRAPGRFTFEEIPSLGLRSNHVMHESVHCIVRALLQSTTGESALAPKQRQILDRAFEEACANAVEVVAAATGSTTLFRLFMAQNNFQGPGDVGDALERVGCETTLKVLIVGYLCANMLCKDVAKPEIRAILEQVLSDSTLERLGPKAATRLFRRCLRLNVGFRLETTASYLKLSGFEGSVFELLDFDYLEELGTGNRLRNALEAVVDLIGNGTHSPFAAALRPAAGEGGRAYLQR